MADGSRITKKKGGALFKCENKIGLADVIFGDTDDSTLLGAFTLASLGLALDPINHQLRELPMVL